MNANQLRNLKRGDKVVILLGYNQGSTTSVVTKVYRGSEPYIRVKANGMKFYAENVVCQKL